jgi:hypothetical protein
MRQLLRVGLVAAVVAPGAPVAADPATPQISPLHRQREDAQRLTEQQRSLERAQPADAASALMANKPPRERSGVTRHTTRGAGLVLLAVGGVSAIVALPLRAFDTPAPRGGQTDSALLSDLLLVTSALTATAGIVLVLSDRTVSVAPALSSSAVGVTVMGRM